MGWRYDGGGHRTEQCLLVPPPPSCMCSSQHLVLGCLPVWLPFPGLHAPTCRSFRSGFEDAERSLALRQPGREGPMLPLPFCPLSFRWPTSRSLSSLSALSGRQPTQSPAPSCLHLPLSSSFPDPISVCPCHCLAPASCFCLSSGLSPAHVLLLFPFSVCICLCLQTSHSIISDWRGKFHPQLLENRDMANTCW